MPIACYNPGCKGGVFLTRSKASIEATAKWENKAYDKVLVRLPRGTKAAIVATGSTVNGFIVRAVQAALDNVQAATDQSDGPGETTDGE